jgi:hypothetical protein
VAYRGSSSSKSQVNIAFKIDVRRLPGAMLLLAKASCAALHCTEQSTACVTANFSENIERRHPCRKLQLQILGANRPF